MTGDMITYLVNLGMAGIVLYLIVVRKSLTTTDERDRLIAEAKIKDAKIETLTSKLMNDIIPSQTEQLQVVAEVLQLLPKVVEVLKEHQSDNHIR